MRGIIDCWLSAVVHPLPLPNDRAGARLLFAERPALARTQLAGLFCARLSVLSPLATAALQRRGNRRGTHHGTADHHTTVEIVGDCLGWSAQWRWHARWWEETRKRWRRRWWWLQRQLRRRWSCCRWWWRRWRRRRRRRLCWWWWRGGGGGGRGVGRDVAVGRRGAGRGLGGRVVGGRGVGGRVVGGCRSLRSGGQRRSVEREQRVVAGLGMKTS